MIRGRDIVTSADMKSAYISKVTQHREIVSKYMNLLTEVLRTRSATHDDSKMKSPEFDEYIKAHSEVDRFKYGSDEYNKIMSKYKDAYDHHKSVNPHHPEYHSDGINGMSLVDLIEMICDWKSANDNDGRDDWDESFEYNCKKFGIDSQLKNILHNTVVQYLNKN